MRLWSDSLLIIAENWQLVLGSLSLILMGHFVVSLGMRSIFHNSLTQEEYLSLGLAGWILPASLLSILWYGFRAQGFSSSGALMGTMLPGLLAILFIFRTRRQITLNRSAIVVGLLGLLCMFILLRLAFISRVLLPQYFDSVRHYTIIRSLLEINESASTATFSQWLGTNYYHVGFHFLAAFVASSMHASITKTMLVLGQMFLVVTPLSVFFLIKHETQSNSAGIFAVFLAGVGWSMPAYAVNWGKYPAITSLILIQFVLSLAYLAAQSHRVLTTQKKWTLSVLLLLGIILAGLFHNRSIVVIGIAFLAWITAKGWQYLTEPMRVLLFCMLVLGMLFEIVCIQRQEVLEQLFDPYGPNGFLATFVILILFIFAQKTYPKLVLSILLGIFLVLGSLFIPTLKIVPRFANLTLLDRTFVEISLYLPLSYLGGLGLAGLERALTHAAARLGKLSMLRGGYLSLLLSALIVGNALIQYDFYPSECCTIVGQDDLTAMNWMSKNLPSDARILVSANELIVQASGAVQGYAAADAGAWITALTDRGIVPLRYDTNLGNERKFKSLCRMGIDYIYIGSTGLSFHAPRLRAHPEWYRTLFSLSRTEVYQVIGCP